MRTHWLRNGLTGACTLAYLGIALSGGIAPAAADPRGVWQAMDGSRVRIASCGGALCGTMVSASTPTDPATGRPWTDKNNPDAGKRNRPLIGLMVLISMRPSGPSKWSGQLYDNDRGQTFEGHIQEQGPSTIRVEGCLGAMCGGENMTRVGK
jgi:uncharacterized protein (DUF2147 family)